MRKLTWAAAALLATGDAFAYETVEDFAVKDATDAAYGIFIERNTSLSHRHGWIEDGAYRIAVDGNRHFVAAPALGDFRLEADFAFVPYKRLDLTLGLKLFFRYDRKARKGRELDVYFDRFSKLHFDLDGRELRVVDGAARLKEPSGALVLDVKGERGCVSVFGECVDFALPADGAKGSVGFDQTLNEGSKLLLKRVALASSENPAKAPAGSWDVTLPRSQGCLEPPRYRVEASRYATGELEVSVTLSGFQTDRPAREQMGGEWSAMSDRVTSPYVKLLFADGSERKLYLWNGQRAFGDPYKGKPKFPWPCRRTFLLDGSGDDWLLAAGYEHVISHPWRFAENGPYEAVLDRSGALVHTGEALGRGGIAFAASSPADKKIVSRLPADLPMRERALKHAREQHYFLESEVPRFTLETVCRAADFAPEEITVEPRVETAYGDDAGVKVVEEKGGADGVRVLPGGFVRIAKAYRLTANPGVGVWHLETRVGAAPRVRTERTVFEVLPDDPEGPCPPLASGLPLFVSMPNEIRFLEESAFDPWSDLGGAAHYYSVDMRYPDVGERLRAWEADHVYRRRYFTWVNRRNARDLDMNSAHNREIMRHADYFGGYPNGKHQEGRFDFAQMRLSGPFQRQVLDDYIASRNLGWKIAGELPTEVEFERLYNSGWDDFKAYAKGRVDAYMKEFVDYLLSVNPKLARASYGPMPVYTARYKSPYTLEYDGHPVEDDPRLRANGSFFLFEDYHYSCDYPLCRPAYFVAAYRRLHPQGRRIYPEIYYPGFERCADGAVYQAHPDRYPNLAHTHQRRIAYRYAYGTPYLADGTFAYWTDYGFHARTPRTADMDEFLHAWGRIVKNRPVRPPRSPFVIVDPDAFRRFGDFFEKGGAYSLKCPGSEDIRSDVNNLAEESVGYAYEQCVAAGYATPVVATLADLDALTPGNCEFAILPPLAKSTPPAVLEAVRRAKARGVRTMGFIEACGLEEDLDVFVREAPTLQERESFLQRYARGRECLSARVAAEMRTAFARLAPSPAVRSERGTVAAAWTAQDDLVVVIEDDSPLYGDTTSYPATFRFTLNVPGIGERRISSDAPFAVVSREKDRLVVRTETAKDTALFFRFAHE